MKRIAGRTPGLLITLGLASLGSVLAAEDIQRGETIAQQGNGEGAIACMSCHGPQGEGNAAGGFPRLAGLPADYPSKQLHDYRNGTRQNPVMQPFANALSDEDS